MNIKNGESMLIGIIKEKTFNDNYYVYLDNKGKYNELSITHVNNDIIEPLSKEKAKDLLNKLLSSKLTFLEKENEYDIYLDEANNKRYFKNGKEDIYLFFSKNGIDANYYLTKKNKIDNTYKKYRITIGVLSFTLMCSIAGLAILGVYDTKYNEKPNYTLVSAEPITVEEMVDLVCESPYLDTDERELLCNDIFFAFVLENSHGKTRTFHLRNALTNLNIKPFKSTDFEGALGYYNPANINSIRVLDVVYNNRTQFNDVAAHEFIHLMQDQNDYYYILESSAEMMEYEFFDQPCDGYSDMVRRVKVLMEIIGPQPVIDCNFSGDTKSFEDSIGKYLSEKDKNKMLELLKVPATKLYDTKDFTNSVNTGVDELLAKMYKNKTGKDIKDDPMIQNIYRANPTNRIYFNPNRTEYNERYQLPSNRLYLGELDINDVINSDKVKYYQYSKKVTKEVKNKKYKYYQNQIVFDINKVPVEPDKIITIVFKDGTQGTTQFDIEKGGWKNVVHYNLESQFALSIPEKFPEQARKPYIYDGEEFTMVIK